MTWAVQNRSYVEGRVRLSGGDPDQMLLSHVLDVAYALLVELFQSRGMSLFEALDVVAGLGKEDDDKPQATLPTPTPQDEQAGLTLLGAQMKGSDFKGAFI